ncbi:MAG: ATPase [Marinilabiliaceae bacterium]|nr:ATPase [Marinilabiliaceae bacterium]
MILIADGGSTSVDWCIVNNGKVEKTTFCYGINPFIRSYEDIYGEIKNFVLPNLKDFSIETIYFFGAGCLSSETNEIIRRAIAANFNVKDIRIDSDLMGAALALCRNNPGIVGILGTGSNSCFYDGEKITEHIPPLGYILGDEGSGAVLGRTFLNECLKNQLTKGIKEKFLEEYNLTIPEILNKVYNEPMPNKFLGQIADFLVLNFEDESIKSLVRNSFADFFRKNILQYDYKKFPVNFVGSVAFIFQETIKDIANDRGINIGEIHESPMDGLIEYYSLIRE